MPENKMSDIIKASMDGIKSFTDMETVIGNAITTPSGVTVIPVSKVAMGIATGGIDYGRTDREDSQNFGGGGGTGLAITPIAFLTVGRDYSSSVSIPRSSVVLSNHLHIRTQIDTIRNIEMHESYATIERM